VDADIDQGRISINVAYKCSVAAKLSWRKLEQVSG